MKIKGRTLDKPNQATVTIVRAAPGGDGDPTVERYELLVTALPMGWQRLLRSRGLSDWPTPKVDWLKDAEGRPVYDKDGKAQTREVTDDPKYVAGMTRAVRRHRAVTFAEHLRADENVAWDSQRPPESLEGDAARKAWAEYADSVATEMEAAGFTDEEVTELLDIGAKLGSRIDVEARLKDFLST